MQDIENVDEEPVGVAQYSDADVILPHSDLNPDSNLDPGLNSAEEERDLRRTLLQNLTEHLTDKKVDGQNDVEMKDAEAVDLVVDLSHVPDLNCDLKELVAKLVKENQELKKNSVCKICMDAVYNKPLVTQIEEKSFYNCYLQWNPEIRTCSDFGQSLSVRY